MKRIPGCFEMEEWAHRSACNHLDTARVKLVGLIQHKEPAVSGAAASVHDEIKEIARLLEPTDA